MATVDYIVLGSYLLFLLALGPVFNRFNRNASDYFRAGGSMVWWIAGTAVVMGGFSAWSFTGGAARVYETGFFFLALFACNFVAMWFTYFFLAARFRQMRVVTGVEAIRKRFGPVNEQVFTWIQVPQNLFFGGLGLYTLAVFSSVAFGLDMVLLVVMLGAIVLIMSVAGGSWAINAGQFVQSILFLAVTAVMVYATLAHEKVGGLSGLLAQLPARHFDWTHFDRPSVLVAFIGTLMLGQLIQMNALKDGAGKYLIVKDGRDARRVTLLGMVALILLTPMWMIPAMGSVVVNPDLKATYGQQVTVDEGGNETVVRPGLRNANEAAYVAMARQTLPPGLLGLLVCAIFSASIDNLSTAVNVSAGVLVRNFYLPRVNPAASDRRQVWLGRVLSVAGGLTITAVALMLSRFSKMSLYNLVLLAAAAIGLPQAVPMFLGLFVRRAPSWSLWSTLAVGFATSLVLQFVLTPEMLNSIWGGQPLNNQEMSDAKIAITTGLLLVVCTGWFLGCAAFGRDSAVRRAEVDAFFAEMNTPVAPEENAGATSDERQYRVLSVLCLTFGGFIAALAALPNSMGGRGGLLFCGGTVLLVGLLLRLAARRSASRAILMTDGTPPPQCAVAVTVAASA